MHQNNNALQKAEMVLEYDNVAHGELSTLEYRKHIPHIVLVHSITDIDIAIPGTDLAVLACVCKCNTCFRAHLILQ